MTEAERQLWQCLRRRNIERNRFRKRVPVGPYVADFVCLERRLIVEVDGSQHVTNADSDPTRTQWLESQGFRVIRFWNNDVLGNIDAVLESIRLALDNSRDG